MIQAGLDGYACKVPVNGKFLKVIVSWGGGWDHVSVSTDQRCPTWDEMCAIKDAFFSPEECCVQFHPAKSDYRNYHPFCLHIWRCQAGFPTPPGVFVGPKEGQSIEDAVNEAIVVT